ncbi:MAG: hypothetical protein VX699_03650 [Myxococcota bacterium]|nr:hypothetical protein [Myxococcota bacterium]
MQRVLFLLSFVTVLAMLSLPGCGEDCPAPGGGIQAYFAPHLPKQDTEAATWLGYPFPADHRRTSSGAPDFSDFPNPRDIGLLDHYGEIIAKELSGFSPISGVYLSFNGSVNPASLPSILTETRSVNSAIQLIDISADSPEYGMRRPLRWEYWDAATNFFPKNTLAAAPVWGTPLRQNTTYAFVVTNALKGMDGHAAQSPALVQSLLNNSLPADCGAGGASAGLVKKLRSQFAPLRRFLKSDTLSSSDVVAATVFTTGAFTHELQTIYEQIQGADAPALTGVWQTFEASTEDSAERDSSATNEGTTGPALHYQQKTFQWSSSATVTYNVLETGLKSPNYQHGQIPYNSGGAFAFAEGVPQVASSEDLRLVITLPATAPPSGECYPVVIYAHGTGGDAYSFVEETAGRLAARGLAGISMDQPLHGQRKKGRHFSASTASFNFANPDAARSTFRQGAVDIFALTRRLQEGLLIPAEVSPTANDLCLKGESIGFFGHSQGGITGAMAAAYEEAVDAWMFSGTGGGLSITILERKDLMDFKGLMTLLLQFQANETLTELHPTLQVIQSVVDITDPIHYAPYWSARSGPSGLQNILLTSGEIDAQTPHRTGAALALAARIPQVAPVEYPVVEYEILGIPAADAPVSANVATSHTSGFLQWRKAFTQPSNFSNHFLIFHRPEAINASMRFLETNVSEDAPIIERSPSADVR